jgi:signal transduction histidine kinase
VLKLREQPPAPLAEPRSGARVHAAGTPASSRLLPRDRRSIRALERCCMRVDFARKRFLLLTTVGIILPVAFLAYLSVKLQREMFSFQNYILQEYARFSVDYAVSQVQELVRAREREVHMHYRLVAKLQEFDPGRELQHVEASYPMVDNAFLKRADGVVVFADENPDDSDVVPTVSTPMIDPPFGSLTNLAREQAESILDQVLDSQTYVHLLGSSDTHFFRGEDPPFHLAAFGLFDADGEPYGVAGFFLKLPYVREKFLATLLEEAIEAAEGRFSPEFGREVTFVIHDHNDALVYVHKRPGQKIKPYVDEYLSKAELWDVLPGWDVRLVYSNPKGPRYQRTIWVSNTILMLVMGAMAVVGILLSMRFILRQMELANLKSHFVSNITHELKTPLAAIRLYTETLQQRRVEDTEQEKKFLGVINKESVRLTHLINNILDFSRIEQGQKRYRFESAAVGDVVRDVVDSYAYQLRAKGFELQVEIEPELPPVWLDRDALSQAVLNLLDNAVKYSRSTKEVHLAVRSGNGASAGGKAQSSDSHAWVDIVVQDRGVGIPASEQSKVFDAFYRVEKGLEHDVKGSGLGLAVVKHVVEAHGGRVQLESGIGSGTTFTIRLPVGTGPPHGDARA